MSRLKVKFVKGRKSPYMVRHNGKRHFFASEAEAEEKIRIIELSNAAEISEEDIQLAARTVVATRMSLRDLIRLGLENLGKMPQLSAARSSTFRECAAKVVDEVRQKNRDETTIESVRSYEKRLNAIIGDCAICAISQKLAKETIESLKGRDKKSPAQPGTKYHYFSFFKRVMAKGGVPDAFPDLHYPQLKPTKVDFFTSEEMVRMFNALHDDEKGLLVVAAYVGLRPALISQLSLTAVDVEKKLIRIAAHLSKDGRSHTIAGQYRTTSGELIAGTIPESAWTMLRKFGWHPAKHGWVGIQRRLKAAVGRWIPDGLRHTAATYCDRFYGPDVVKRLLTHAGEKLARERYVGDCTPEEADAFYSIDPARLTAPRRRIPLPYPPPDELRQLLEAKPATLIARQIGCSNQALSKHCAKHGIPTKPRGYWAKIWCQQNC